jgi:3-oxoacyl-[acyl-carrier protein] reductase
MDFALAGRIALVAGSSRGIGKAIANAFLAEGCRTAISGRRSDSLNEARAEFASRFGPDRVLALAGDMTRPEALREARSRLEHTWGTVDCLVANIGTGRGQAGWELPDDAWSDAFEQNLRAAVRLVSCFLPDLVAKRGGSVVLIGSIAGLESLPAPLPYGAAKAALASYAKSLSREVGPSGVRVNLVAPGNILFPGGSWERKRLEDPGSVQKYVASEVPLQRFGRPEEIADLVVFLSSDRASFLTGACVVADGGQTRSF